MPQSLVLPVAKPRATAMTSGVSKDAEVLVVERSRLLQASGARGVVGSAKPRKSRLIRRKPCKLKNERNNGRVHQPSRKFGKLTDMRQAGARGSCQSSDGLSRPLRFCKQWAQKSVSPSSSLSSTTAPVHAPLNTLTHNLYRTCSYRNDGGRCRCTLRALSSPSSREEQHQHRRRVSPAEHQLLERDADGARRISDI